MTNIRTLKPKVKKIEEGQDWALFNAKMQYMTNLIQLVESLHTESTIELTKGITHLVNTQDQTHHFKITIKKIKGIKK